RQPLGDSGKGGFDDRRLFAVMGRKAAPFGLVVVTAKGGVKGGGKHPVDRRDHHRLIARLVDDCFDDVELVDEIGCFQVEGADVPPLIGGGDRPTWQQVFVHHLENVSL